MSPAKPATRNTVRIIGGQWRRLLLNFPDGLGLRPTPDRVRETLFNWLGQTLDGQHCLDLFAGSGALGFEAASRGAARVVLIEKNPTAYKALQDNRTKLHSPNSVEIFRADALEFAARLAASATPMFDGAFLDPPYHQGWLEKCAPLLDQIIKPDGFIYVEAEHELTELGHWATVRHGKAGQVYYHLMRRVHEGPPEVTEN